MGTKPMSQNTECASYLGVFISEYVLRNVFSNVEQMPYGHKWYDFVCDKGYKVDVKGSTLSTRKANSGGHWYFNIRRNTVADYFVLLAFDHRMSLKPMHCWLVPASVVSRNKSITISQSTVNAWKDYEQDISAVAQCCDDMRSLGHI